jgi:protease-4
MADSSSGLEGAAPKQKSEKPASPDWERELISRLALSAVAEQRRARRWGIFFKALLFLYLFALLVVYWPAEFETPGVAKEHTALVDLEGLIAADAEASAENIITGLRDAFEDTKTKGVILRINSPGGSPVQAGYVYDEIKRLREKYPDTPLYAVISDMCASGGYYIASAADKIYADRASVVGSIGVRMDSFGFVGAMHKLGIERRLLTAGEHKGFLDPFLPVKQDEKEHVKALLDDIHRQFIERVKEGRGERLASDDEIFSGLVWTGEQSLALGLIDGLGSASYVAREVIGVEKIVDFTPAPDYLERLAKRFGMAAGEAVAARLVAGSVRLE